VRVDEAIVRVTHRIDPGTASTWCGKKLEGVPHEGATEAYLDGSGMVSIVQAGDAYDCGACKRVALAAARRAQRRGGSAT
jgi:hypothetical protein